MANALTYNGKLLVDQNGHVFKYGADSGSITITSNGIHDVNGIATAIVNVKGTITYVFEVVNHYTGAVLSGATIQIKHNGTLLTTIMTDSSGIASYDSKYTSIDYTVSYSNWPAVSGTITVSEIDTINTNVQLIDILTPSSHTPGEIASWDNKEWLVCHYDSSNNRVYLITKNTLGTGTSSDFVSRGAFVYYNSSSYHQVVQFMNKLSSDARAKLCPITVNSKDYSVCEPTHDQMNGGFSWFNSNTNRKCDRPYWISDYQYGATAYTWYVNGLGEITTITNLDYAYACVRPCVCVQL